MQWADCLDFDAGEFFQDVLHLHAIFSDDVDVVASCFAHPVFAEFSGKSECAERIGGEQNLFGFFVAEQNFGPVDHRGCDKL